ncbi:MAG: MFS transporter [Candidatus Lokiarchaeota archaeon]|nr:MFS transporter [Candidatus Lokiarchaeota archaeon]MBD3201589.1 MFS transporter [Candidatus Lokiarchaeota archaeon]
MAEDTKIMNRWLVLIGAVLIQLSLGSIYSWGVMTKQISGGLFLNEVTEVTAYIFGISLAAFAVTMIFAGKLQQKYGPRNISLLGALFIGIGTISSAFMQGNFVGLFITYGVLYGVGIGFAYVCPIATAAAWFPDKKGMINGIAVAGFGAGSFIFNFLVDIFATISVPVMYILLGIIYVITIIIGAIFMIRPPDEWLPEGFVPPKVTEESSGGMIEFSRKEMLSTKEFWMLWLSYILGCMPGLLIIGTFKDFGETVGIDPLFGVSIVLTLVGSIAALFNGLGRISWGKVADLATYKKALIMLFAIQATSVFLFYTTFVSFAYYLIMVCVIYFCFGGNLSLYPTATADLFGNKNLGQNYGIMFTAYGIAGFIQAVATQTIVLALGGYLPLYIIVGIFTVGSLVLVFLIKPPKKQ